MALGLALCAGLCMAALAFFAAGPLVSLFNRDGDPALQQMAEQGLRLYFLGFPFAGLNLITASFLGAAEHPGRSLRLSLLRGFVAIVAAALLLAALLGLTGVWLAFPAAEGAVLLVSLRFSRIPPARPARARPSGHHHRAQVTRERPVLCRGQRPGAGEHHQLMARVLRPVGGWTWG